MVTASLFSVVFSGLSKRVGLYNRLRVGYVIGPGSMILWLQIDNVTGLVVVFVD